MTDPKQAPASYLRSTSDQVAFWVLWVLLLLPAIVLLMMVIGSVGGLILIPLLAQLGIHGMALKWFLDLSKPTSKALLMLLGGTGVLYFLAFSGCVIMLFTA
ncbi:hypothetical protein [uncultured Thiothrix sp.]|uniref:hypothetical protein n=1 Tax=uncultured Thiothrix sp. TaxID=223185 RepID=UPI00260A0ABD|nr:hypothetical protein [uncultured Thiothrix sp.]